MVDASSTADGGTSADGDRSASCSLQGFKQALELLKGPTDERRCLSVIHLLSSNASFALGELKFSFWHRLPNLHALHYGLGKNLL